MVLSGCATTTVSQTMMIPLHSVEPAAVAANEGMFASAWGAVSAVPIPLDPNSSAGLSSDTGDQIAGVQPELGGMLRIANHLLLGGNVYASPTSAAQHATNGQLQLSDELMVGFRTRVGVVGQADNGFGFMATFGWGLDFMPYRASLGSSSTVVGIGASLTAAPTYQIGIFRLYLGLSGNSQPTIPLTVTTCSGCGTSVSYDIQIAVSGGTKIQIAPSAALMIGVSMPLVNDRIPWMPIATAAFVFDFIRPQQRVDPDELPPPPPIHPTVPPLPPPPPPPL